ncbi:hypothetical protein DVH05_015819 [Phytophthora capsici]|nr:hypothetical protein DVH05_015817 [Phytophthora capsici]KAG1697865.1 hypothetical protein DVH05_015819 [Phytophthora capsici]
MRLFIKTLVALAVAFLATSTEAAKAVQTGGNVDVVQSSHIVPGENKRLLRSERDEGNLLEDDEENLLEDDEEERKGGLNLFSTAKMEKMLGNDWYKYQVARRWKRDGYTWETLPKDVPVDLVRYFKGFRERHG